MTKQDFLLRLREGLCGFSQEAIEEYLDFYSEIIDDRMEEGLSEEEAVADIGSVKEIVEQILAETSFIKIVKDKIKGMKKLQGWEIVLLAVGSPIWLALLISALAVVLSLYVSIWSVIVSLWAAGAAVAGSALGGVVGGLICLFKINLWTGLALLGAGLVCAGLAIFLLFGCKITTAVILRFTGKAAQAMKSRLMKKEETA